MKNCRNFAYMTDRKLNRRQWLAKIGAMTGIAIGIPAMLRAQSHGKCTDCGQCMPCLYGVDIPAVIRFHATAEADGLVPDDTLAPTSAEYRTAARRYLGKYERAIHHTHQAHRCIQCWHCLGTCPENIFIVEELEKITALTDKMRDSLCYE